MIAAGWSTPEIGAAAREMLAGWYELLTEVATEAAAQFGGLGPFSPAEAAALIGNAFIGAEALLLLGFDRHQMPIRASLRRVGELIRAAEERRRRWAIPTGADEGDRAGGRRRRAGRRASCTGRCSAPASRRSPCCRRGRSSTRASGSRRCPISPATSGWSRSTAAAGSLGPARRTRRAYSHLEFAADTLAVLDATDTDAPCSSASPAGRCGACRSPPIGPIGSVGLVCLARRFPSRRCIADRDGPSLRRAARHHRRVGEVQPLPLAEGGYRDFLEFFADSCFTEPHSTKQIEDFVGWALEIDPATLVASDDGLVACGLESFRSVCERIRARCW